MSVTQVKKSQSRAAFPFFRLGGGCGATRPNETNVIGKLREKNVCVCLC